MLIAKNKLHQAVIGDEFIFNGHKYRTLGAASSDYIMIKEVDAQSRTTGNRIKFILPTTN